MEIEFNTSRISQGGAGQPVARQRGTKAASDTAAFTSSASLKDQLNQTPTVRAEQVQKGQALVNSGKYPPDDVLDRIAILLAVHVKGSQTSQ